MENIYNLMIRPHSIKKYPFWKGVGLKSLKDFADPGQLLIFLDPLVLSCFCSYLGKDIQAWLLLS